MFTHFKNIDTAFKHIKVFSICFLTGNVLIAAFASLLCYYSVDEAQQRVYILHNGKELSAFASDRKTNLPVVLRDHIKTFHEDFFNLSPDDKVIQTQVTKALYLADESAKKQYDNLRESYVFQKGQSLSGSCSVTNQRLLLEIRNIRIGTSIMPVNLTVFSLDGMAGINAPEAELGEAAGNGAGGALSGMQFVSMDQSIGTQAASAGISAAKELFTKKVKKIRVRLKGGQQVLLRINRN
ncbi:conjugative transposon protein TraM [Mucilaginibacter litoreus]|uniref:Conjugative transposon protein TraM n=1 Tax=Mucilaginibacter litoreus TaxID=1048221 RepID=A0ABW3AMT9_9SPHI